MPPCQLWTREQSHLDNFARRAEHNPARLELRCRAHNAYQAVLSYGEAFIDAARAARDRAREPCAIFRPRRRTLCSEVGRQTAVGQIIQRPRT